MIIMHTANKSEFEAEIQTGSYGSKSLGRCGFIHCSDLDTYYLVAPNFKNDYTEKVILLIDTDKLNCEVKWEDGGGLDFPHIYGLLNQEAIVGVYEHLWSDTREWIPNEELAEYAINGFRRQTMELRKINVQDAVAQWEYTTTLPADENGLTNPYHGVSFEEYREKVLPALISYEHPVNMPDWFVPETYYYLWNECRLIGEFRIRHYLTEALRNGAGHIGYSIRKEERGKGYGTAGLKLTVQIAKEIMADIAVFFIIFIQGEKLAQRPDNISCFFFNLPDTAFFRSFAFFQSASGHKPPS